MTRKILVADLLCGAGGSSTGCERALAELGLKMELVCVNHWATAIETHTKNHPNARHFVQDISTVRPHLIVPEGYLDLLMASPTCTHHSVARGGKPTSDQQRSDPWHIITWLTELRVKRMIIENVWEFCFPPETPVLSKRGMVPIGSIQVGDEVWTHNARWKPVVRVKRRRSSTVRISGYGNSAIETTPNHEFYARQFAPEITVSGKRGRHQGRLLEPEWVCADQLAKFDDRSAYTRTYSGYCWATPKVMPRYWRRMPDKLGVDTNSPAFFYMLGRWLGDGWIKRRKDRSDQDLVRICANLREADELERRLVETGLTWRRARHTKSVDIFDLSVASSRILIRWLRVNFGEYAHLKTLPAWIYGASVEQRWALIDGYHAADGHTRKDGVTSFSSVSRCLAVGMRLLLQSVGVAASMTRIPARQTPSVRGGTTMNCRETFAVSWRRNVEWEKGHRYDLHIWGPVRKVGACRRNVEVVDITVADDHSFIADGQVVHNCGWGPVDPRTGKPIQSRKGEYFRAWIDTIRRLGFDPQWKKLNAADYGDATTRQRFILMARSDAKTVVWPVPTHARKAGEGLALFPTVKPWRPAREIIDWNIKGKSIFTRKKPLAPKTLARIHAGAVKFGWPEPFLVILRNHMAGQSVERPLPTIAASGTHIGLAQPIMLKQNFRRDAVKVDDPVPTIMTEARIGLAEPIMLANRSNNAAKNPDDEPVPCLTTAHGGGIAIAEPVIMNGRKGNQPKAVSTDPVPTLDTKGGVWLAEPFVLSQQNSGQPRSVDVDPLPTITTGGAGAEKHEGCARPMLVEPFILSRQGEGAPRSVGDPTPTQCAKHSHVLVTSYYGATTGAENVDTPLPTITTKDRFGIVVPVTHTNGSNQARSVDDPVPTLTTAKGGEFAIVMPVTHAGGFDRVQDANGTPLPTITGANRGELAVITAQHGERDGQAPRVHSVEEPVPTIAATGHVDLAQGVVTPVFDGQQYDILFRMLEPHELAAAMGFTTDEATYEFAGTKTEQIKQIGNAVSVRKMRACVAAIMADAAPKRKPAAMPGQASASIAKVA